MSSYDIILFLKSLESVERSDDVPKLGDLRPPKTNYLVRRGDEFPKIEQEDSDPAT
jgi:hypothetical protein